MIDFLESIVPCRFVTLTIDYVLKCCFFIQYQENLHTMSRYSTSKRLISHDIHSNTYNYKYTFSVEIVPICKDDIVCLSNKMSKELGSVGPICICLKVTTLIHLIDPRTLKCMYEFDYYLSRLHQLFWCFLEFRRPGKIWKNSEFCETLRDSG
jgi:hypothetical protein